MHKWGRAHWDALLHLSKYLVQTADDGMFLQRSESWRVTETKCFAITDAGEIANPDNTSRAIIGHVIFIENNIISFGSKLTSCVATESSHGELIGIYKVVQRITAMLNLFVSLHPITLSKPIKLYGDNLASLWIARTCGNSTRTKHYNLKLH